MYELECNVQEQSSDKQAEWCGWSQRSLSLFRHLVYGVIPIMNYNCNLLICTFSNWQQMLVYGDIVWYISFITCCSRTSANKPGSEAAEALYSGGRQRDDEYLSKRQNPMMMTMKKPMNTSTRRPASPPARSVSRSSAVKCCCWWLIYYFALA